MKNKKIRIVENPAHTLADESNRLQGGMSGNYNFWTESIFVDGVKIAELECTDSSFPYCQIHGTFDKKAHSVEVEGTEIGFETADRQPEGVDRITLDRFIELGSRKRVTRADGSRG